MTNDVAGSARIDTKLESVGGWRAATLVRIRDLIREADPDIVEDVKWVRPANPLGVPTWEHDGIVCTGEIYKTYVKLTFAHGAALDDPAGLFNTGFGGGTRRAIDIREDETVDAAALTALVTRAVEWNVAKRSAKRGV